ncbi:MAG: SirB2 family protein [Steroidobacteraceae bacterium]
MLAAHYLALRNLHIGCVTLSGTLFVLRGTLHLAAHPVVNRLWMRVLSWCIDTALLTVGALLMITLHLYPPEQIWLTVKLLLLLAYIVLGYIALKRARTRRGRAGALLAALLVFAYMVGVAVHHHPAGWFA